MTTVTKVLVCLLTALLATALAIGSRTELLPACYPEVPERCPGDESLCPTCCCNSSANVDFYNPDQSEPECTAPPAKYEMRFVFTWSGVCHPDYYFPNDSLWSPPTGVSHNPQYRMWDACMDNTSLGVGLVSQTGNTSIINMEYMQNMANILDTTEGELVKPGSGVTSSYLIVDKNHQYASAISMLFPSPDRLVGVADLRLCDGAQWKDEVQVCFELFSTATATEKVVGPMERNSVQASNCSFGYVRFILKPEDEPRSEVDETCEPLVPKECPGRISDTQCPTCCCGSTDNVEFYDPSFPEPQCTAPSAYYNVEFVFTWNAICHPDYYFPGESLWTPPTVVSHNTEYRMWDACMDNASPGVGLVSQTGDTSVINQEYELAGNNIYGMAEGDLVRPGSGRTSRLLKIDKDHQFVSGISMLVPSPDRMVGVADLRLCDDDQWKREVQVCFELFSTATASAKVAPEMERNSVQENNCSFGYVRLTLQPQEEPRSGETRFAVAETCEPLVPKECPGRFNESECPNCCCESSDNVEFYEPSFPEPQCTAPSAYYNVEFVFTWNAICHPDYYFPGKSLWTPPTVVSHNTEYRMWDACMDNASPGVGLVSRTGNTSIINQEYTLAGNNIYGMVEGDLVQPGSGRTSRLLKIDKDHQFVSGISMLVPSPDRMVGVADLRLCDDDQWKREVQVCFELFSTATASAKVAPEMERNSVQENNCSFGYVRLTLQPQEEPRSGDTRFAVAETCEPLVPKECPGRFNESECPNCCCESSDNVEFYEPSFPEPQCTAPSAYYNVEFVFTWNAICHPDYYFPGRSLWTPPTVVSHNTEYRMWDACMDNASPGVGLVSRTGNTSIINQEYTLAGNNIYGMVEGDLVRPGSGRTSRLLKIDKDHQFVSGISMLVPSPDRMVGVADLRLCDGDQWKREVQVCFELFSTATASAKVAPEMERNSFQENNCSFGYVRLTLQPQVEPRSGETRFEVAETCEPHVPKECPGRIDDSTCPICCCESTDNVEFYDPNFSEPECTASESTYNISFVFTWSAVCHPDYYFPTMSLWTPPTAVSHNTQYKMWDACMDNASPGIGLVSRTGNTSIINQEYTLAGNNIYGMVEGDLVRPGSGRTSRLLKIDKDHQFVSGISMLVPSPDRMVGVADLRLCDGDQWKREVQVCFELFSTATASAKVAPEMERNSFQENNCSFGYVRLTLQPQVEPRSGETRFEVAETCEPHVPKECPGRIDDSTCPICCCESTDNVEFYDPNFSEPECTASESTYNISFVFTWSAVCHPDYYFPTMSLWTPPTAVSHNTQYKMWDACMDNASPGIGLVSRTGNTSIINQEYTLAGNNIYGMVEGDLVRPGSGETSRIIKVDNQHQFVSAASMLVPSPDRMVGVADLRLCDGDQWKREVQVCFELFSTATASAKVAPEMERNSFQENNCSFGYVRLTLQPQVEPRSGETRFEVAETCEPHVPKECPGRIDDSTCPICCCESTDNVEFYDPNFPEPECTASESTYNISFVFTWSAVCHPDYYFPNESLWSPPTAVSHNTQYKMWDACMDNASPGIGLVSRTGNTSIINQEYTLAGNNIYGMVQGDLVKPGSGETSRVIKVNNQHQFVSAASMLVPSPDRMVGVADLRLCDGDQWKREVQVCFELFSTATATDKVAPEMQRNSVQANNCSFGYVRLTLNAGSPTTALPLAVLSALGLFVAALLKL